MESSGARMHTARGTTSPRHPTSFETLPVEVVSHIFSYLVVPRSRLPGLTETQSSLDFNSQERSAIKRSEDLTMPADTDRWAVNLFQNHKNQHPFLTISLTSRRCRELVEGYCSHLCRSSNRFNLPFEQFDKYGPKSVCFDMTSTVYRRLWLQTAARHCIYCFAVLDVYPFPHLKRTRLLTNCKACFYRQTLVPHPSPPSLHMLLLTSTDSRRDRTTVPYLARYCGCVAIHPRSSPLVLARRRRSAGPPALRYPSLPRSACRPVWQTVFHLCNHQIHALSK